VIARHANHMHGENISLAYSLLDDVSLKGGSPSHICSSSPSLQSQMQLLEDRFKASAATLDARVLVATLLLAARLAAVRVADSEMQCLLRKCGKKLQQRTLETVAERLETDFLVSSGLQTLQKLVTVLFWLNMQEYFQCKQTSQFDVPIAQPCFMHDPSAGSTVLSVEGHFWTALCTLISQLSASLRHGWNLLHGTKASCRHVPSPKHLNPFQLVTGNTSTAAQQFPIWCLEHCHEQSSSTLRAIASQAPIACNLAHFPF
jgi:hypothetical protein